ncbi:signal peptidase I [Jeotgalibaca caeni]|uniref:signal peptidase I n=1 Tax=Jeotgalibaca caeni TaxID=3028623 RepID=UPI00237EDEDA|nr:signal peptidase I [Jeotgalibaca caeni]MDE1549592.1 signal peptidase I [Jeotgalibaca caeni]
MKLVKRIIQLIFTVLISLFILIGIMNFLSAPSASGLFGHKGYIVISGSMEPAFSPGDYAIVKGEPFESIGVDEVITFLDDDTIVTHRVKEITEEGLVTKGDANNNEDAVLVARENYIGTLKWLLPGFGSIILFLQQPFVFPVMIFLVGAYVIYLYFHSDDEPEEQTTTN